MIALNTPDPTFSPDATITVNGYEFVPAARLTALRDDLHRVQRNTAEYREESRLEVVAIRKRTQPCVDLVARIAGWTDSEAETAGGKQTRMIAQRAAEGIVDAFPHVYSEADRERALGIMAKGNCAGLSWGEIVDSMAEALGMRRAGA